MRENVNKKELSERTVWVLVGIVFLSLSGMLMIVFNNEKTKPQSPHALVATAFNQRFTQDLPPGARQMQTMNQTIDPQQPVWRPLPARTDRTAVSRTGQGNSYPRGLVFQKIIR